MKIRELYKDDEEITLQSYFNKKGIIDIEEYLNPSGKYLENPINYDNMVDAMYLFRKHLDNQTKTYIICDPDLDGCTSVTLIYNYMTSLNPSWDIRILIHSGKQRGLDDVDIMNSIENNTFVIIPDAGTNNNKQCEILKERNVDLLVLDHHQADSLNVNQYGVLVNNQFGNVDKEGSGCLVTHMFVLAMDRMLNNGKSEIKYIDLVALSIISDSMNVASQQNRLYLEYGILSKDRIQNKFIRSMFDYFIKKDDYTMKDIAFTIVPKFNSAIRTKDQEFKQAIIGCLIGFLDESYYKDVLDKMASYHKKQQDIVSKFVNNITDVNENNNIIIEILDGVERSYSGLIAGKVKTKFNDRPTIVGASDGKYVIGSLRSPVPLREEFINSHLFEFAQGHDDACGVKFKVENIENIHTYFNHMSLNYGHTDVLKSYMIQDIPINLFSMYEPYMKLWGHGLEQPLFHIKLGINTKNIKIIGANKRTIRIEHGKIKLMIFNCERKDKEQLKLGRYENEKFVEDLNCYDLELEIVGSLCVNEYNGYKTRQVIIEKYEVK